MKSSLIFFVGLVLSLAHGRPTHRILGVFPRNSHGDFIVFEQLMKSLADRGHEVHVISRFPQLKIYPNYLDVIRLPDSTPSLADTITFEDTRNLNVLNLINTEYGNDVCHTLGNSHMQNFLRNPPRDKPYSLVVTEVFIANCFIVLGHVLKAPVVGVSTYGRLPWVYDMVNNPEGFDYVPEHTGSNHITFAERLSTIASHAYQKHSFYRQTRAQDAMLKHYVGKNVPGVRELESSVALVLTNAHESTHGIRALTPSLKEVGGMHIVDKNIPPLYEDIREWLDESKNGAVYLSLGNDFVFESLPEEIIRVFYRSFKKLMPMRVLMRVDNHNDLPPGLPDNVMTVPWVQQVRVLQHANVRAFITHGGLQSLQEAFYTAVPVVGVPLWDDQFANVDLCVKKNIGVKVDINSLTEKTLDTALHRVLNNATFKQSAHDYSVAFLDRAVTGIDTASYWIEYVMRHGSDTLKLPLNQCTWWQCINLDVFALFFAVALVTMVFTLVIIRKIIFMMISRLPHKRRSHHKLL